MLPMKLSLRESIESKYYDRKKIKVYVFLKDYTVENKMYVCMIEILIKIK